MDVEANNILTVYYSLYGTYANLVNNFTYMRDLWLGIKILIL